MSTTRIKELEARIKQLEAENKQLRQTNARNSTLAEENASLKQQVDKLSTRLFEVYDAVGIMNKMVMNNERRVRRDS
nr:MAG TPA: rod shape determining protein [Caudoviricetes sp.]